MSDRKTELERKKKKLQMMREEKERRQKEREAKKAEDSGRSPAQPGNALKDADEILSSFGILPTAAKSHEPSLLSSMSSISTSEQSVISSPDTSLQTFASQQSKRSLKLCTTSVQVTDIPPKELVQYSKQTQTASSSLDREGDDDEASSLPPLDSSPPLYHGKMPGMPHVEMVKPAQTVVETEPVKVESKESHDLSEEEKQQIMMSEDFHNFFDKTTRIIERVLSENIDIVIDYSHAGGEELEGEDKSGIKLSENRVFYDERWSKNRTVTCIDWSLQHPELLVASYNNNKDFPHDPDGVALVWNMKFKKTTPEYIFHCQSPVMSACFAKFHPNLIIGGTYSGQIVLWDNRTNKRTPIQRSPLSTTAHTHPVYCVKVVGTQNAHNLISISTDGKLCTWSLDMLSVPQDSMELQHKQSKAVAATCLSFPSGDVNNFIVGSEEGTVYTACRHGSKAGVLDVFEGHQGPVTGIDTHNAQGQIDFSHLFLTSSFDWTVKLWSLKENKPIYSFDDNDDYVFDVCWSPVHPAVFASVDGKGQLDIWNLNNDAEGPTISAAIDGSPALNRVSWSQSGWQVVAGDDIGKLWVYDVGEQLVVPRSDEWTKFGQSLQELKNNQGDEDLDINIMSSSPMR